MSKIDLDPITSGYNLSKINSNFQRVEDELNNKVLYREASTGEPNQMDTNLDMNGKEILNVSVGTSPGSLVTRGYVDQEISEERTYVDQQLAEVDAQLATYTPLAYIGAPFGVAPLDGSSKVPISNLPHIATSSLLPTTIESIRRSYAEAGYNMVPGSFENGGTLTVTNNVLLYEIEGKAYSWGGVLPKVVPPASSPSSTGGISPNGYWVDVGDASVYTRILSELSQDHGSSIIGAKYGKSVASSSNINLTHDELSSTVGVAGYKAFVSGLGSFTWNDTSTTADDGVNVIKVTGVATGRWARDNVALSFVDLRSKQPSQSRAVTLYEHRAGFKFGGGSFVWDATSTTPDNGGTIAAVTGIATGRWVRVGYSALDSAMFGLPKTGDCLAELQAIEAIQFATGMDCYFNIDGTYETVGEVNWPWRQETVPAATFKDYKGARLVCKGPGVVFKTTSATGADILQLNSVANFSVVGWPTLTAVLTGTADAGSNGVSVTNGGKNVYCEVEAKDLPFTVKPEYLDGGKAITIQNGASTLLPYQNVKLICRQAVNCAYGATADIATQPLVSQQNWYGNLLDVTAIDCYRAAHVSADSPTEGSVPSNGLNMGLDIVVDAVNCQQDYIESRGWCVNAKVRTQRNKGTAGLIGKNPNDSQVFVDQIVASYGGSLEIDGGVTSVDYLHGVGGLITTNGNSQTKMKAFRYSVRYQGALASNLQVFTIDAGGNTATACTFNIFGTVGFSATPLASAGNSVFVNGVATLRGSISA